MPECVFKIETEKIYFHKLSRVYPVE